MKASFLVSVLLCAFSNSAFASFDYYYACDNKAMITKKLEFPRDSLPQYFYKGISGKDQDMIVPCRQGDSECRVRIGGEYMNGVITAEKITLEYHGKLITCTRSL